MDPQWQYNHLVIPLSISIFLILALIGFGIRRRQNPTALPYLFFMVCLLVWMVTSLLESITLHLPLSLLFADISFLGITFFPIAWLGVVMIYVGQSKRFYHVLPWLIVLPILTNIMIWTNPLHHLWRGASYRDLSTTWFPITIYNYGPWYSVHLVFSLAVTFIATFLLIRPLFFREKTYRSQIIILLVSINLPLSIEILHQLGFQPIPYYNLSILVFPISGLLTGWVLLRYHFLDLMPIARDLVVESMEDLMLVLDEKGRLIDLNPAARQRLFQGIDAIIGKSIDDLLPDHSELLTKIRSQVKKTNYLREEVEIYREGSLWVYEIMISPITHRSSVKAGWLLLLRDITTRKQTEQAFYKQVQQIAILEERQRLARELHDSVSQTLFAARMLADLLPRAIDKKPEKVREYAFNIQQLIHGTTAEMRLVLLELYPDALIQTDLGTVIKHLCDAYMGSTGTTVDFTTTSQIHLEKEAQLAFYRIAQEALQNISKHTEATKVSVNLLKNDGEIELSIQDNGPGFDLDDTFSDNFGLNNMFERAKEMGAELNINSNANHGTMIKLVRTIA